MLDEDGRYFENNQMNKKSFNDFPSDNDQKEMMDKLNRQLFQLM